jgi:hypothetical protein
MAAPYPLVLCAYKEARNPNVLPLCMKYQAPPGLLQQSEAYAIAANADRRHLERFEDLIPRDLRERLPTASMSASCCTITMQPAGWYPVWRERCLG